MLKRIWLFFILLFIMQSVDAQMFLGFNTGFTLSSVAGNTQSPSLLTGYKINHFSPYFGFDFEYQEMKYNYKDRPEYNDDDQVITTTPTLGMKYSFIEKKCSPILDINISKEYPIIIKHNKSDHEDKEDVKEAEVALRGQNDNFSGNICLGIEYIFSDNISLSGEYGINIYLLDYTIYDYWIHDNTLISTKASLSFLYYF